ncbi:hypothetical protein THAOC_25048, partial [Thalassiosira oceanica]
INPALGRTGQHSPNMLGPRSVAPSESEQDSAPLSRSHAKTALLEVRGLIHVSSICPESEQVD